ncbi:MAG TPA: branched-chain amino acid ABC transporter ATP-binding protein/permease [Nevskiaceae bacterium]
MSRAAPLLASVIVALFIALFPLVSGRFMVSLFNEIGIAALVALGLVLLTGVGGAVSFGQAAFVGIAAYATGWLTLTEIPSPWLGLLLALALTFVISLIIGMATLRLAGHFLALSTLAWGIAIPIVFGNVAALGRFSGLADIPAAHLGSLSLASPYRMYYLIWIVVGLSLLFSFNLLRSRTGRAIRGLRGGNTLLASVGANAYWTRVWLFVIAALLAALAGWLYAHTNRFISPSPFDLHASIDYLLMAILGGLGSLFGSVLGAGVVHLLQNELQNILPLFTQYAAQLDAVVVAAIFILLLHFARAGVMGYVLRLYHRWPQPLPTFQPGRNQLVQPLAARPKPEQGKQLLAARGVVKRFGGLIAVNDVSFEVNAGEIVGLIGPNGAGKSTMFNLLTRTLPMSAGHVEFLQQDISKLRQLDVARLGVARTFQHVKLRPRMSLIDNVAMGAYARGRAGMMRAGLRLNRKEEEQIMEEARAQLERVGLVQRAYERAGSLPLGTQRILEIARALTADPVLLLLDEPAAGLRKAEKHALADLLRKLRDDGITILLVEHDMDFVMNLVDRLVVMSFGSKLAEGTPAAVRADAKVQAAYLGSST